MYALKKTGIPIASEQAKAAKINTTVFIQKATCIVVGKNIGAPESGPRTRPTKPATRLVCLLNYNPYLVSVFSFSVYLELKREGGLNIRGVELIETIRYISHPTEGYTQ